MQPDQQRTSMKALYYLLITTLLTVTSYGADKPIPSLNGFEGWGKDGVNIIVLNPERHTPQEVKAIESQMQLALVKGDLKRITGASDAIQVDVRYIKLTETILTEVRMWVGRDAEWKTKDGKRYTRSVYILAIGNQFNTRSVRENVQSGIIMRYREANQKK